VREIVAARRLFHFTANQERQDAHRGQRDWNRYMQFHAPTPPFDLAAAAPDGGPWRGMSQRGLSPQPKAIIPGPGQEVKQGRSLVNQGFSLYFFSSPACPAPQDSTSTVGCQDVASLRGPGRLGWKRKKEGNRGLVAQSRL
jgi:hypothetical protein